MNRITLDMAKAMPSGFRIGVEVGSLPTFFTTERVTIPLEQWGE